MFAGCITGLLTGLFGVGGGFLIVPALIVAAKMPLRKAITTSLMIIFWCLWWVLFPIAKILLSLGR